MAVRFYDEAIATCIQSWIKDPSVRVLNPDESTRLFEMTYDLTKDKPLQLPIIAISRGKTIDILNTNKQPLSFKGLNLDKNEKNCYINLTAIPIHLTYQLDIYCKSKAECDEYARNFIFNIINYPKQDIIIPYNNINFAHDFEMDLGPALTDNSDIKEHMFPDQFTRYTLTFDVNNAYLFSAPVKAPLELVEIDTQTASRDFGEIESVEIVWVKDDE